MENTNSIPNSYIPSNNTYVPTISNNYAENNGFIGYLKSVSFSTWIIIILILAFLGFNIFIYLAKGTQNIANLFAPLLKSVFGITLATTGKVVDVSAEGAKAVVSGTANVIDKGLTNVQNVIPKQSSTSIPNQSISSTIPSPNPVENTSLNRALNTSKQSQQNTTNEYEANEATSSINNSSKSGWCYIGEDRGFRTCAQVGVNDECMSGDIFPTNEICINPSLRT